MDEVFWSNVVKRWSEAAENVIALRKELTKVQEERALYRSLLDTYRRSDATPADQRQIERVEPDSVPLNDGIDTTSHVGLMQDAEAGLGRAKEEYKRLQQELAASTEQIKALKQENETISAKHIEETTKLKDQINKLTFVNDNLRKSLEKAKADAAKVVAIHDQPDESKKLSAAYWDLERQVETLKLSVKDYETENHYLRSELSTTQERLHRAEDNSKVLLGSIKKLQGITRHATILRPLSNTSLYSEARRSSGKLSAASGAHSPEPDRDMLPKAWAFKQKEVIRPSRSDGDMAEKEIVTHNCPNLPPDREAMLAVFPSVPVPAVVDAHNAFERSFLKKALGEDVQSLFKYLPEGQIDRKAITSSYLCPTLNHHPWCPSNPGQHGFLFVGLGKERDSYNSPAIRNLFVGLPKGPSKTRTFRYLGKYKVTRVKHLSIDEWNSFSPDIKYMYAKLTADKTNDVRPPEDILLAYDKGTLSVPCVQLQFISFDNHIYSALLAHKNDLREHKK